MCEAIDSDNIQKRSIAPGWRMLSAGIVSAIDPDELSRDYDCVFKQDDNSTVALKSLMLGDERVKAVIKIQCRRRGCRGFLRSMLPSPAAKNFRKALLLASKNIPVVRFAAALEQKHFFLIVSNISIFVYIENSMSLYDVLFGKDAYAVSQWAQVKKEIINEIAFILASLRRAGFWHRDSKAGNFLIYRQPDDSYKVKLIDLDGIKRCYFRSNSCMMRTLCNLAETVTRFRRVSVTDLWRGFGLYCDEVGIAGEGRRVIFRRLQQMVVAKRLLTEVRDSYKKRL